jgi:hypothetical protein
MLPAFETKDIHVYLFHESNWVSCIPDAGVFISGSKKRADTPNTQGSLAFTTNNHINDGEGLKCHLTTMIEQSIYLANHNSHAKLH